MQKIKLTIDNKEVEINKGATILQACEKAGIDVPRFCYHERLSIAGNCRMCLVEVEKSPKLVASCAMGANEGMKVFTNTATVRKAREGILELLLINHPLDCPICDQGGECDLQDQALIYGSDRGRFNEFKRAVIDKNCGPIVKTIMTRCIHCTRCIRFATEVAGVPLLGTSGRGNQMEVGTYITKLFNSEISGNVVDLCPVGALTSKPYAFTARSWELKSTPNIDILDPLCSNTRIDTRGAEVMRILPRINEDINACWISDKARFSYDGARRQRLLHISGRFSPNPLTWHQALDLLKDWINPKSIRNTAFVLGNYLDNNTLANVYQIAKKYGITNKLSAVWNYRSNNQNSYFLNNDFRYSYLMTPKRYESSDFILFLGCNPRIQIPVLNAFIRQSYAKNHNTYYLTASSRDDLTYPTINLGKSNLTYLNFLQGRLSSHITNALLKSKKPYIVTSSFSPQENLLNEFLSLIANSMNSKPCSTTIKLKPKVRSHILPHSQTGHNSYIETMAESVAYIGASELGIPTHIVTKSDPIQNVNQIVYMDADDIEGTSLHNMLSNPINNSIRSIYIGHHGDIVAPFADLILPTTVFFEKEASYYNIYGLLQNTIKVSTALSKDIRDDSQIIQLFAYLLEAQHILPYTETLSLKDNINVQRTSFDSLTTYVNSLHTAQSPVKNHYMNDAISRSSSVMAKAQLMAN